MQPNDIPVTPLTACDLDVLRAYVKNNPKPLERVYVLVPPRLTPAALALVKEDADAR